LASQLERSRTRVRVTLVVALFYWLDIFLFSLPPATSRTPDILLPIMLIVGLPLLAYAVRVTLEHARSEGDTLAYLDDLTGLGNRRSFRLRANDLLNDAKPGSVALVLVDVDGLKRVNDTCGHQSGDELLAHVGQYLGRAAASSSNVFRFGGDEFAILIDRGAGRSASEVVAGLGAFNAPFKSCGHDHHIAISYGFVSNLGQEPLDVLFQRADQRLREFKNRREGRSNQPAAPDYTQQSQQAPSPIEAMNISILEERRLARRAN